MKLNVITAFLFFCLPGFLVVASVNGKEIPIKFKGQKIGSVFTEKIKISEDADRIIVATPIEFDSITQAIDNYLKKQGDFIDGCSKRLYWVGGTSIRETGKVLKLSSRARYEQWSCTKIFGKRLKTRLFRDTKTVHWELFFDQEKSKIIARLTNIKNFPGSLERWFGLTFEKEIDIPVPEQCGKCSCKETVDPKLERADFSQPSDGKVVLEMAVSFKKDFAMALRCF